MAGESTSRRRDRARLAAIGVVVALFAGAAGIVTTSGGSQGGSSAQSAASAQYCPPPAQGPSKPKGGANKCGQPKAN